MSSMPLFGKARTREPVSKAGARHRAYFLLLVLDACGIVAAFVLAGLMRSGRLLPDAFWLPVAALLLVFVLTAVQYRAYSARAIFDHWASFARAIRAVLVSAVIVILLVFFLKLDAGVSRITFAIGTVLAMALVGLTRLVVVRHICRRLAGEPHHVVVIRDGETPLPFESGASTMFLDPSEGLDVIRRDPMAYDRLARGIAHADRVIVHCPPDRRIAWAAALRGTNVQGEVVAPELDGLEAVGLTRHQGHSTLIVSRRPLDLKDRITKRVFDAAVAGFALLLLAPLMLIVATAIRLTDNGPVFFVQTRIGRSNRLFQVIKFRSMYVADADAKGDRSASRDDHRITPVGRILRATSVDELPQLFNVLKGDMSIVGPRPHAIGSTAEDLLFWEVDDRYWHRHTIKPGLTGLAQVRGFRGATHHRDDLVNRLQSDLEYVDDWTIWRDLLIVARTAAVLFHRNAF